MDIDGGNTKIIPGVGMEKYVADGNDAIEFKLVRRVQDLEDKSVSFKPEMCHQIFGEGETVFGYEDLKIKLYFTAGSLKPYVGISFKRKISPSQCDGVQGCSIGLLIVQVYGRAGTKLTLLLARASQTLFDADEVVDSLMKAVPPGYVENIDEFTAKLSKEKVFHPYGELIHSFKKTHHTTNGNANTNGSSVNGFKTDSEKNYEIYSCDTTIPKFEDYLRSMEAFIMFFIDAASFVDPDDEKWKFFVMYEKYQEDGESRFAFVGYAAAYNFYCYPDNIRPRIAQMVVLPPFQKQGLAIELLSSVYSKYRSDAKVAEITVEDPSDDFELLRDYVDVIDCMRLSAFAPEKLKNGYSEDMANEAKTKLKITKRQSRRIYEILRLRFTDIKNEEEFKNFRLEVKRRLNIPYQKQEADLKRIQRRNLNSESEQSEAVQKSVLLDDASRKTELESNFQNVYEHYKNILKRLERYGPI